MITKEELLGLFAHEIAILKHLYSKVLPDKLDYKPTEKQRTTLELLRYLSYSIRASLEFILKQDMGIFTEATKAAESLKFEDFPVALDASFLKFKELLLSLTESQMDEAVDLWGNGVKTPRRIKLFDMIYAGAVAYRMQLFLYLKASGRPELGTSDLWSGVDQK